MGGSAYAVAFVGESEVVGGYPGGVVRRWNIKDRQQQGPSLVCKSKSAVRSIAASRIGWRIVSGNNKQVVVWNAVTHKKVRQFTVDNLIAIDISSDSTKVAFVNGGTVKIFIISSGIPLLPPITHGNARHVMFSPDGSRIAVSFYGVGLRVYSTHNGDILFDSGRRCSADIWDLTSLAWSSDGQQLFVTGAGEITCLDLSRPSLSKWSTHENLSGASIASNGKFIACSAGLSVSFWDCVSHKQIGTMITHTQCPDSTALSPSGGYLACTFDSGNITIHNLRDILPPEYFDHARCDLTRRKLYASHLPLVQVSDKIFKSWTQGDPTSTETLLSDEIRSASTPCHYALANRALIRARLKHVTLAIEDAKESLQVRRSPIGYIAMALALLGQGDREGALCTFDLAFHDCELYDIRFLLLLKLILVFECGNQEEAITRVEHLATRADDDDDDDAIYLHTHVLGVMCVQKGSYERAIPWIKREMKLAPRDVEFCPALKTISLIFGWSFDGPDIVTQQRLCESFYAEERTVEAAEVLLDIIGTPGKEIQGNEAIGDWITELTKKLTTTLEHVGDEAFRSVKYNEAITQYSAALSLGPPSSASLLLKRSRARAEEGLWKGALQDANEAVDVDPSCPWGYEAEHRALHGGKRYDQAIDAFRCMLHVIEQSHDPEIRQLRKNYISASETIAAIDAVAHEILKSCPLVVIDVTTGCLCDGPERIRIFKDHPSFKELVSSMTRDLDNEQILRTVTSFFGYAMFSHALQGNKPSFRDVNVVDSVWNLPNTPPNVNLRNFCKETRRLGHNWAWSHTCCIDKAMGSILGSSLTSMYKWYAGSAATLVFLADVAHPSKLGDLTGSVWMTRAWTLQELLAPKVILFYDSQWQPYLGDTGANHKESPEIMQELADCVNIPCGTIVAFSPDGFGVRDKLRLASARDVTVEEDVAYSLIGMFKSDIKPNYGEGTDALGHLLEEIVARSGEVTVLAWSGKSSSYNSCLPAFISVYNQTPYNPPSLQEDEMETRIVELREKLSQLDALILYNRVNVLPPARFVTRRLYLPCIVFSVRRLRIQEAHSDNEKVYCARVSGLGEVEFTTADDLPLKEPKKLVFAHPWIGYIRGPSNGVSWGGDSWSDTDPDSDSDSNAGSDGVTPPSPPDAVPVPQVDDYTRALQMIARLGQPFNGLLLVQQPNGEYKRVAAEHEIVVSGLGTDINSKNVHVRVLEIL